MRDGRRPQPLPPKGPTHAWTIGSGAPLRESPPSYFWINVVKVDPHVFAHGVAVGETLIAVALLFGIMSNLTNIGGILLTVVIWTTAEGFGGPYAPGSADIGSAIIYSLVFVGLFLSSAGLYLGFDRWVTPRLGRFGFLASGPFIRPRFVRRLGHKENVAV